LSTHKQQSQPFISQKCNHDPTCQYRKGRLSPPAVTDLITSHIDAPRHGRLLDPCAGEGETLVALALPLLPDWSDYLWQRGRQRKLITLCDDGNGQGCAAWQVKPTSTVWQELVQAGLVAR